MSQFTIYRSTDGSAPTLSGTVGDLVNLLDKCLVAGYGSQSAAGWTKPLTGTNKAAFKQGGGNQFYLRVQDDAPGAGGAKEARLRGYETMSDVDTGTGLFPTVAQMANGVFARKSTSADGTTRPWIVVADDRTVYVFVQTGDSANVYFTFAFGDFYSLVTGDGYRTFIVGRSSENSISTNLDCLGDIRGLKGDGASPATYVARNYLGVSTAITIQKHGDTWPQGGTGGSGLYGTIPFPNPTDGGIYLSPVWLSDITTSPAFHLRGKMRGMWHFLHAAGSLSDGDTFSGVGDLSGKTFLAIYQVYCPGNLPGTFIVETSNTLDTN